MRRGGRCRAATRDDKDALLLTGPRARISSYCEQHRDTRRSKSLRRRCSDDDGRQPGFRVNDDRDESSERYRRRREDMQEPATYYGSCLKKTSREGVSGTSCTTRAKKHVNFHDATSHCHHPHHHPTYDDSIALDLHNQHRQEPEPRAWRDNDAVLYERGGRASGNYDECKARAAGGERRRSSGSTTTSRQSEPSSRYYSSSHDLADNFNRLSLTSSCTSTSRSQKSDNNRHQQPRVTRRRDALGRAAAKQMLVYPPEGQVGAPLTVMKKWSNVACHVRGDAERGYRYKVYYLQAFESEPWYPDEETGGPFRSAARLDYSTSDVG